MNFDLKFYLKVYQNWVDVNVCKEIVNEINNFTSWEKHGFYNLKDNLQISYDSDFKVCNEISQINSFINERIWKALEQYVLEDFNLPWFTGWNGFTPVRYNKYESKTEMKLHCDHIQSMFDGNRKGIPTLTVLGGLNNDYEGGKLVMWENEIIELKVGDIAIFPSNFLYPHKVTPVTQGTRYSYVSWVW